MSSTYPDQDQAHDAGHDSEQRPSIGALLGQVSSDVTTLLRQEVDLAKAEAKKSATDAGKGVGMFAGAGIAGQLFLVFLSVSAWWGLGQFIGNQWSGLVVAVVWGAVAGILAFTGKKELASVKGLPETADSVGKIPNALKGHEEKN